MHATLRFAKKLGLPSKLQEATDPFLPGANRGKILFQKILKSKYELCVPLGDVSAAITSFNNHSDFFGRKLKIKIGRRSVWTGCVAFGIELWALVMKRRWGDAQEQWPAYVKAMLHLS